MTISNPGFKLRDYQREAVDHVTSRWAAGDVRVPIVLATGLGKGSPVDASVPTPEGFRRWGDLAVGDRIFGRHGDPVTVTNIFDRGTLPAYRVTFSDETSVDVDGDHLWAVRDSKDSRRKWGTATTAELAGQELKLPRGWRFHIPMAGAARFDAHSALPLDPYTVGALISNGSMLGYACQLTTPDRDVVARIVGNGVAVTAIDDATPETCPRYHLPGLRNVTALLGMRVRSPKKRIPARYLMAEVPHRVALLQGLMDGDGGNRDATRRSVSYFTSSPGLAQDVRQLVNSLGGTGIVKRYDRGQKGIEYAVRILLPSGVEAFSTSRKADDHGTRSVRNMQPKRAIVSIEPIGNREIRCITVDAPDHLYLMGDSYTVTHNTQIFTSLADEWLNENPGRRVLIVAHTDELIAQALKRMRQVAPRRRIGRVQGQQYNEVLAEIVVSSRQTLARESRRAQIRNVGLIIIDECHHAIRTNTYGKILDHYGAFDEPSPVSVLGVTATLARGDKEKLSSVWQDALFSRDILFGIRHGYLLDVRGERIIVPDLDLSRVRISGGDYSERDLGEELERTFAPEVIAKEYARLASYEVCHPDAGLPGGPRYRRGIAFWPLVDIAHKGTDAFNIEGIRSATVSGLTPKPERRELLQRFHLPLTHSEAIDVMHNAMVLTEGFDEPIADVVVIARPTRSAPLFQQMVGRVLRPNLELPPEQREKALILDVHGAGQEHGLRTLIDLSPDRRRDGLEVPEDLSLAEIDEWIEEQLTEELEQQRAGASMIVESDEYRGEVVTQTFDPLGRDKVWGATPAGHHFITAGSVGYVFLAPSIEGDPGTYDVVTCSKNAYVRDGVTPWVKGPKQFGIEPGLPLEMALNWGEDIATRVGGPGTLTLNKRKSSWRRAEPSEAQKGYATKLGISIEGKSKGELSEAIDAINAARRIDPIIEMITRTQGGN